VADQATADDLKAQIDGGADFAALATERSEDTATKDAGGDAGWIPKGFLSDEQAETFLFNLEANEVSVYPTQSGVFIYQVLEKQADRPIDEDKKDQLAADAFTEWTSEKEEEADITNEMDFAEGDVDKLRYVIDRAGLTLGF
jgi:parvulin-like peptidyl-prolyl isomerase